MSKSIEVSKSESYRRGVMMLGVAFFAGAVAASAVFVGFMPRSFEPEVVACGASLELSVANTDRCIKALNQCTDTLNPESAPK
jgi:hypothetical protein